jgi:hypothetical protein
MVTRDELIRARTERERAESERKTEQEAAMVQYREETLLKDTVSAMTLLDGQLGKAIREYDIAGYTSVRTNGRSTYTCNRWLSDFSPITFAPNPEYSPTKVLVNKLIGAGFDVKLTTVQEQNTRMKPYGDGEYEIEIIGGSHPVYWIEIMW